MLSVAPARARRLLTPVFMYCKHQDQQQIYFATHLYFIKITGDGRARPEAVGQGDLVHLVRKKKRRYFK